VEDFSAFGLTFTTPGTSGTAAEATIAVTLFDEGGGGEGKDHITANDFSYDVDDATALSEAIAKTLSAVNAKDAAGNPIATSAIMATAAELANVLEKYGAKLIGDYDLTFKTPAGSDQAQATITVTLYRSGDGLDTISAKDAQWGFNQARPILVAGDAALAAAAKALTEAAGTYYGAGGSIAVGDIIITPETLANLKAAVNAGTKGAVNVTFVTPYRAAYPDAQANTTVKITLFDGGSDPEESIYANHFNYGIGNGAISGAQAKAYAKALAFEEDGTAIDAGDILVTASQLQAINTAIANKNKSGNPYPLTFSTKGETGAAASVTIGVTLYDEGSGDAAINANDFSYGCNEPMFTGAIAKRLSRVTATDADGNTLPLSAITADAGDVAVIEAARAAGQTGVYPLTFTESATGKSVTVEVTLMDSGGGSEEHITAYNFRYGLDEANLTAAIARSFSGVLATDANGAAIAPAAISVDQAQLAGINIQKAAGNIGVPFGLTFRTSGATSQTNTPAAVTIYVILTDGGGGDREHITAYNFEFGVNENGGGGLIATIAKNLSNVAGQHENGSAIPLALISLPATAQMTSINAAVADVRAGNAKVNTLPAFPLTFATPGDAANGIAPALVTVQVTLKDNGGGSGGGNQDHITGNNIRYDVDNPTAFTEALIRALSEVSARNPQAVPFTLSDIMAETAELANVIAKYSAKLVGDYNLTFRTPAGQGQASVTVKVTLYRSTDGKDTISANSIYWDLWQAQSALAGGDAAFAGTVKALTGAAGRYYAGGDIPASDILVTQGTLNSLKAAVAAGVTGQASVPVAFQTPYRAQYPDAQAGVSATVTLVREPDRYYVSYNGNGQTGGAPPADGNAYIEGSRVTVQGGGSLTRTGYTFSGWAVYPTATAAGYFPGNSFAITSNVTFYAVWTPAAVATYSVAYRAGALGTNAVSGLPSGMAGLRAGTTYTISTAVPVWDGYTFTGWTSSTGANYQPGNSFRMPAANVVLTATWDNSTDIVPILTPLAPGAPTAPDTPTPDELVPDTLIDGAGDPGLSEIGVGGVPLYGLPDSHTWALMDLLITIATLALLFFVFFYRRRYDLYRQGEMRYATEENRKRSETKDLVALIAAIVAGLGSLLLFVLTQDLSHTMVLLDIWTIIFLIAFGVELFVLRYIIKLLHGEYREGESSATAERPVHFDRIG
jgi:uncharacterized repeat protein (TIGR02543 family)